MYVCMCLCICVCLPCKCACVFECVYVYIYICKCVWICVWMLCIFMCVHVWIFNLQVEYCGPPVLIWIKPHKSNHHCFESPLKVLTVIKYNKNINRMYLKREITLEIEVWKLQVQKNTHFVKFRTLVCLYLHFSMLLLLTKILKAAVVERFAIKEHKTLKGWNWQIEKALCRPQWFKKIKVIFFVLAGHVLWSFS